LKHGYEAECMRQLYEPLYRKYGVDIVISGHDHQYERSAPVFDYKLDPDCGTVSEKRESKKERNRGEKLT